MKVGKKGGYVVLLIFLGFGFGASASQKSLILRKVSDVPDIPVLSKNTTTQELNRILFSNPKGVALSIFPYPPRPGDDNGFLFVVDNGWNRILFMDMLRSPVFDDSTLFIDDISSYTSQVDKDTLRNPQGIAADNDPDGDTYIGLYIADTDRNRVMYKKMQRNKRNDGITEYWVSPYIGYILWSGLNKPTDVEFSSNNTPSDSTDDYLWVVDRDNHRLIRCRTDGSGTILNTYGSYGIGLGQFDSPLAVASARDFQNPNADLKKIYVADAGNKRIVELSSTNNWATISCSLLYTGNSLSDFIALDVDPHGFVWVADQDNQEIIKINPSRNPGYNEVVKVKGTDGGPAGFYGLQSITSARGSQSWSDLFVSEYWSASSGGRWYRIGVDILDSFPHTYSSYSPAGPSNTYVDLRYTVTDPGYTNLKVYRKPNEGAGSWVLFDTTSVMNRAVVEGQDWIFGWTVPSIYYGQPYTYKFEIVTRSTYQNSNGTPVNTDTVNLFIQPLWGDSLGTYPTLSVSSVSRNNQLSWTDPFIAENVFYVQRKISTSPNWLSVANVGANITTYLDDQCLISRTESYNYRVRTQDKFGAYSPWSNTPTAPATNLPPRGDVNGDGGFSPADVVIMLDCAFATGNCDNCFSDVNCSGSVTPADIISELYWVFLGVALPC